MWFVSCWGYDGFMHLESDKNGHEHILEAYALILKYDCPALMDCLANGLAETFRFLARHGRYLWCETFVKKHVDFIKDHTGGRYPAVLAPAIAEAWTCVQANSIHDESRKTALLLLSVIESEPGLAVGVAKYYQAKLLHAEKGADSLCNTLRGPYVDRPVKVNGW